MNIVIPMAGLGKRFAEQGFNLPKPLILIKGKPMYRYAVDCLPLRLAQRLIFILKDDFYVEKLSADISQTYSLFSPKIIILNSVTGGQAETVSYADQHLNPLAPILIHNCDSAVMSHFNWPAILQQPIDGAIVTFPSQEKRWSYVMVENNWIKDMQEKKVISAYATTGTYLFMDTKNLLKMIQQVIAEDIRENNEYYLSSVYRLMLKQKAKILNIPISASEYLCFGTPEDLKISLKHMK